MPGESEYHRSFKPLQNSHEQLAGISSAKLAVTQEPAFARKRKPLNHGRKVTFVTDYTEHGVPLVDGPDKAMYFRAGLRRADTMVPTEYQLQYTWKEPVQESPLLTAENMLRRSKYPTDTERQRGQHPSNTNSNQNGNQDLVPPPPPKPNTQHTIQWSSVPVDETLSTGDNPDCESVPNGLGNGRNTNTRPSGEKSKKPLIKSQHERHTGHSVSGSHAHERAKMTKSQHHKHHYHHKVSSSKRKEKKCRHKQQKRATKMMYSTEYRSQFKEWREKQKREKTSEKINGHPPPVAGQPPVLTDTTDPRLLKHSPLPINRLFYLPSTKWGSEYSSNFMSPEAFEYEKGVWKGASQPDLLMQPHHQGPPPPSEQREPVSPPPIPQENSWFDQLLELRHKAEDYKKRAETTHFLPQHLLALNHSSLLESSSTTSSVGTSSETCSTSTDSSVSETHVGAHIPKSLGQQQQQQRSSRMNGYIGASPALKYTVTHPPGARSAQHGGMRVEDVESVDSETLSSASTEREASEYTSSQPRQVTRGREDMGIPHRKGNPPVSHGGIPPSRGGVKLQRTTVPPPQGASIQKLIPHGSPQPPRRDGESESADISQEEEGRVDTPRLVQSRSDHRRHHLDVTTPAGGGLLISPSKHVASGSSNDDEDSVHVQLPFPPTSPKYRKDMKSSAPVFPSPTGQISKLKKGEVPFRYDPRIKTAPGPVAPSSGKGRQKEKSSKGTSTMGPRSVPVSTSPYHSQCTGDSPPPHHTTSTTIHRPPHATESDLGGGGPVRKLLFDASRKPQHTSASKTHTTHHQPATHVQEQLHRCSAATNTDMCKMCGAHLRSSTTSNSVPKNTFTSHQRGGPGSAVATHLQGPSKRPTTVVNVSDGTRHHHPTMVGQPRPFIQSHDHTHYPKTGASGGVHDIPDSGIGSSRRVAATYSGEGVRSAGVRGGGIRGEPLQDFDTLSLSSMSLSSSCSVASEILKKARDRRDHFWARPRVAAT